MHHLLRRLAVVLAAAVVALSTHGSSPAHASARVAATGQHAMTGGVTPTP